MEENIGGEEIVVVLRHSLERWVVFDSEASGNGGEREGNRWMWGIPIREGMGGGGEEERMCR